jgi:hypothetical protein
MKTALITTTINVPHVLKLYRAYGPQVAMFIAGDEKTPHDALLREIPVDADYYRPESQWKWKCSDLIGWNCIQRRNIALLEAVKWGADVIVSIDDDNIPMSPLYFWDFEQRLQFPFNGPMVTGYGGWFDVGQLLDPVAPHRGFPETGLYQVGFTTGAKIGACADICMGDPDIDAVTRIANRPKPLTVGKVSELLRAGIVVEPHTNTVFNSQNTAIIRELAPAFFMIPGIGRYDDIFASLICQRVMRERNLHVHFGPPFVWQQRNAHNLLTDLKNELWGMENILEFASILDEHEFFTHDGSILKQVRTIWESHRIQKLLPAVSIAAAHAFLDDMGGVL